MRDKGDIMSDLAKRLSDAGVKASIVPKPVTCLVYVDYTNPLITGSVMADEQAKNTIQELREIYSKAPDMGYDRHNDHYDALKYTCKQSLDSDV